MKTVGRVKKTSCSLIVRCYNEEQHIGKLLAGVMEQTIKDVQIILVDSGSTDATLAIASRYPVKIVNIAPEEFSFGRALNIGCNEATAEFIVLASAHVYPLYKDWLEYMVKPFDDENVALVYGKQRGDDNARYTEHQIYKKWFPDDGALNQTYPFCNNANSVVRKSLWKSTPFDEELTGLEDLGWAKKMFDQGKKIVYSAEAEIIHVHNESPMKIYNRYEREAIAFKRIYPDEQFDFVDFIKLFFSNTLTDYYHATLDGAILKNVVSIPLFRFMQFWGTYRGYRLHGAVTHKLRNRFYYPEGFFRKQPEKDIEKEKTRRIDYENH